MIRHISFDLWLTLIKSHPEFKEQRAVFLHKEFNPQGFSVREIMDIVQYHDKICDRLNEINGKKVPAAQMYRRILANLGMDAAASDDQLIQQIILNVRELFFKLPPQFLNDSVIQLLNFLKNEGYTLNLSSNTGFIEGFTLRETLKQLNIADYFVFCIFSDEIGVSKPSAAFFSKVFEQVTVRKDEVLHIGDNFKTDYEGALAYGFNALHITNKFYTLDDIRRYL